MTKVGKLRLNEELATGTSLPDQTGNNGKFLSTNGTVASWTALAGGGDMLASTYDPTGVSDDAFSMDNMIEGTSTKIMTSAERTKLSGIATGAEVNVNADWNASSGDAQILNKPTIPTISDTAYDATSWDNNTDGATKNAIRDKIETMVDRVYYPGTLTVDYGTLDTGVVGDLAAVGGTDVNISEATGANPLQVQLDFSSVTTLDGFAFYGRYTGGAAHVVVIEIYNGSTWDTLGQIGSTTGKQWYSFNIYSPSTYIIAGVVKIRFRHTGTGVNTHDLVLDYTELNHGGGGAGSTIVEAVSITFNPTGNIAATDVQNAIAELDTEKAAIAQNMYIGTTQVAINRSSAALTLAGITLTTPNIGTPSAGTLTNCSGLPVDGIVDDTTSALGVGTIELGHASDTTIARVSAGLISVEGKTLLSNTSTAGIGNTPTSSSTTQITHSLGRTPTMIRISGKSGFTANAAATPTTSSEGVYNSSGNFCIYQSINGTTGIAAQSSNAFAIFLDTSVGNTISGVIQNVGATTFDIVWTETGTHTRGVYMWEAQ